VAGLEIKNVAEPDETRPFTAKGSAAVVTVAGHPVLYGTFEPGWRWSEHLKPIAGTESCQATHLLYCLSGRMRVEMSGGEQGEIGPGDVAAIEPGHDAWVVGDEPACQSTSAAMPNTPSDSTRIPGSAHRTVLQRPPIGILDHHRTRLADRARGRPAARLDPGSDCRAVFPS
jgi:hypothetical protein